MAVLLAGSASPASALPAHFYGLNFSSHTDDPGEWEAIGHSGAKLFRLNASWKVINDAAGKIGKSWKDAYGWEQTYDKYIEQAAKNNVTILADLYGRKTTTNEHQFYKSGEGETSEWFEFVWSFVQRYGYGGSFWEAHPSLPYRPIRVWEVWNEPNLNHNNPEGIQQPKRFAEFFVATANTIRNAQNEARNPGDPADTQVIVGGFYQEAGVNDNVVSNFFKSIKDESQNVSDIFHSKYDGVGIHPYSFDGNKSEKVAGVQNNVSIDRNAVDSYGGSSKSLWITELGWAVEGDGLSAGQPGVSEQEQAELLDEVFGWLESESETYNIAYANWYFYRDHYGLGSWDYHCGLRNRDGGFRTSWGYFQDQTGASPWPAPTVVTRDASAIEEKQATLNGSITPNGRQTSYRFEYGTSTAYGASIPVPNGEVGSGAGEVFKSAVITNLQPNTHYHFRVVGTNGAGTTYGTDHSFTTGLKWLIRNSNAPGAPDASFWYGLPGQTPVVGDWDGNGTETPGTYVPATGEWRLRNSNSTGGSEVSFKYGGSQFKPIVGDWDGNGTTTIGLFEPTEGRWQLRNSNSEGSPNLDFKYGGSQFEPVVGDWDASGTTTIGLFEPNEGRWQLRNANSEGSPSLDFKYGGSQFKPIVGDWDGNGTTTIGLFEPTEGRWQLRNSNSEGSPSIDFQYGGSQYMPIVGDWDGKSGASVGLIDSNSPIERNWLSRNSNSGGSPDLSVWYSWPGEVAVVGDWDGNGTDTPGVYVPSTGTWRLRNSNTDGKAEIEFSYGGSQFKPVVGDWDGNGTTTIGLFEPTEGRWQLRNSNSAGSPSLDFKYGGSQFKPVVGDWDASGTTTIGLFEPTEGRWQLRNTNSEGSPDLNFTYGGSQFKPIVGDWDGNGTTTIGLFEENAGAWGLRNANSGGSPDLSFLYGGSQYDPVAADWDGNGSVTVGLVTK